MVFVEVHYNVAVICECYNLHHKFSWIQQILDLLNSPNGSDEGKQRHSQTLQVVGSTKWCLFWRTFSQVLRDPDTAIAMFTTAVSLLAVLQGVNSKYMNKCVDECLSLVGNALGTIKATPSINLFPFSQLCIGMRNIRLQYFPTSDTVDGIPVRRNTVLI